MSRNNIYTPEGVRDILFDECGKKKILEEKIRKIFLCHGYMEIETPALEYMGVFYRENNPSGGGNLPEKMFKFFDDTGKILVLRPDFTECIARVTATKLKNEVRPIKYSYIGNVYRFDKSGGGRQREFTQAGVEIAGVNSPEADAEVIITAIKAVLSTGLKEFQIDIGHAEFFKGIVEEADFPEKTAEEIRSLIDSKDYLGIEKILKGSDINENIKNLILDLPNLFGAVDVIDAAKGITGNKRSLAALDNLREVYDILTGCGYGEYVSIDLGTVQNLDYYTGVIFRGFTYGIGFPFLGGGRYDGLIGKFGEECEATGFAIGINMLMSALERQKIHMDKRNIDIFLCYDKKSRMEAFEYAEKLREKGLCVEVDISGIGLDIQSDKSGDFREAVDFAKKKGISEVILFDNSASEKERSIWKE